jgi:hypothetical protein
MTEKESPSPERHDIKPTLLQEVSPDKKERELLRVPLRLEHKYLRQEIPGIVKIFQIVDHPDHYIITDSLGDRYFIGLTLSEKERVFVEENRDEYDKYNFLTFKESNPELPQREIYRLNVDIKKDGKVEREVIEISYSREKASN